MFGEKREQVAVRGIGHASTQAGEQEWVLKEVLLWPPPGARTKQGTAAGTGTVSAAAPCVQRLDLIINLLGTLLSTQEMNRAAAGESGTSTAPVPLQHDDNGRPGYGLTPREDEVLAQLAEGKSNRQIAQDLVLSVATVKCHVSNILSKMGAKSRTEAAVLALRRKGIFADGQYRCGKATEMLNGRKNGRLRNT